MPAALACTGIAVNAQDGTRLLARTIEWKGGNLNSKLIIMPRGLKNTAFALSACVLLLAQCTHPERHVRGRDASISYLE